MKKLEGEIAEGLERKRKGCKQGQGRRGAGGQGKGGVGEAAGGFEMSGHCCVCGYSYDSQHEPEAVADDLPWEFEGGEETGVRD